MRGDVWDRVKSAPNTKNVLKLCNAYKFVVVADALRVSALAWNILFTIMEDRRRAITKTTKQVRYWFLNEQNRSTQKKGSRTSCERTGQEVNLCSSVYFVCDSYRIIDITLIFKIIMSDMRCCHCRRYYTGADGAVSSASMSVCVRACAYVCVYVYQLLICF